MDNNHKYERAKKRVEEIKGFYIHLSVYVVVNIGIFIFNMATTPDEIWFIYPLLGWGIGLTAHFMSVYLGSKWGSEWEDRKIKELMEKDNKEN